MEIVVDTSAIIAVIVAEPERDGIVEITAGHDLIGPGSIPWEVGYAFSAMLKQRRLDLDGVHRGLEIFQSIPLRYVKADLQNSLAIADKTHLYAYDAYFLDCATRHGAPLLTLDRPLSRAAQSLGIERLEV